jgi:hypothetical protein
MTVVYNLNLRWIGDTWKNCGPTSGQNQSLAADQAFQSTLKNSYATEFGDNVALMNNLTTNLGQIVAAGPGQQGYTAPELAAQNSQAINAAAAGNQKLQTAIGENAAAHGGGAPGVESGVEQAEKAAAATAEDTGLSNTEANITNANYATGRQNYWSAVQGTEAAPGAFENPLNSAASGVNSANEIGGQEANSVASSSLGNELLGLGEGLAGDVSTVAGGYLAGKNKSG